MQLKKRTTPGEHLSVVEEFRAGDWTYIEGPNVRALSFGEVIYDLKERIVKVLPVNYKPNIPKAGDIVVGEAEVVQNGIVNLRIGVVNGREDKHRFMGMMILPYHRGPGRVVVKPGDILRARATSNVNNIIHLTLESEDLGVIHTVCSLCGGKVISVGNAVKCAECGYVEPRKLATDFGKVSSLS